MNILIKLVNSKKCQKMSVLLFGILLLWLIGKNISKICTVWELPDESGYLFNAAFFLGYDWADIRAAMPYYAYGYSIFLMPAVWLCKTGVAVIRSACVTNLLFILAIYFIQIYVMRQLFKRGNQIYFSIVAFIVCLNPYLIANGLKVDCETLLALWVWILAILVFQAVKRGRSIYYFLLSLCSAYIFFIHTRGAITIATVYLVLFMISMLWKKKEIFVKTIISALIMGAFFLIFYKVKIFILDYAAMVSLAEGQEVSEVNLVTINYILMVLKNLFSSESADLFVRGMSARLFYIAFSSGTLAIFGGIALSRDFMSFKKIESDNTEGIAIYALKAFFLLEALLMIITVTIIGLKGIGSNFTYFFYNRYYEHTAVPLIMFGILYCLLENNCKYKTYAGIILILIIMGLAVLGLDHYLDSSEIHVDTARIAGMTSAVNNTNNYRDMVLYMLLLMVLILVVFSLANRNKAGCWLYVIIAAVSIWQSSSANIDKILIANNKSAGDAKLVQILVAFDNTKPVYMVNTPYEFEGYYSRIQVLLKDTKLNVIYPNDLGDISSGSYFFTYSNVDEADEMLLDCIPVEKGAVFNLYQKK